MSGIHLREATKDDIPFLAKILSDWQTEEYWNRRVSGYFNRELHPQKALLPRIIYVATSSEVVVGFIAGHLTERFGCQGELQWINVVPKYRGKGVALALLRYLAQWFVAQRALNVCVDVGGEGGRSFYIKSGAESLNEHWMVWKDISTLLNN